MTRTDGSVSTVAYGRDLDLERTLTERARTDTDAFAAVYRNHVDAVHAFAYRLCGSREVAEEATSATFERALRSIGSFEWRGGGVRPWLLKIASNEVTEVYRRNARASGLRGQRALRVLAGNAIDGPDPSEIASDDELRTLRQALESLHPRYREAITIRYLGEVSAEDAAAELGCSRAVLAVTLYRALGALRRAMAVDEPKEVTR